MKKMTPGCYWASQPIYDGAGRVVGYTGQPNLPESRPICPCTDSDGPVSYTHLTLPTIYSV